MRIIKNIVETLKQELGFIKIYKVENNIKVLVKSEKSSLQTNTFDETLKIKINNKEFNITPNVVSFFDLNEITMVKNILIEASEVNIKSLFPKAIEIKENPVFLNLGDKKVKDQRLKIIIRVKKVERIVPKVHSKILPSLLRLAIYPSKVVEKDKILNILKKYIQTYKTSEIRFIGFFKNVPLGKAEKIFISDEKISVLINSKRKDFFADIVIFKINDMYKMEVIK
ncbi:hypothetical protein [Thermosipho affectus]|uniref:hypothetical protein n=1 Tax=Thermosipho affectus TaxID=660294 RepID=UPI0009822A15|nr:hypothetical protein [Thermosipho affectus]